MSTFNSRLGIFVACGAVILAAGPIRVYDSQVDGVSHSSSTPMADNTRINKRDRKASSMTADDARNGPAAKASEIAGHENVINGLMVKGS